MRTQEVGAEGRAAGRRRRRRVGRGAGPGRRPRCRNHPARTRQTSPTATHGTRRAGRTKAAQMPVSRSQSRRPSPQGPAPSADARDTSPDSPGSAAASAEVSSQVENTAPRWCGSSSSPPPGSSVRTACRVRAPTGRLRRRHRRQRSFRIRSQPEAGQTMFREGASRSRRRVAISSRDAEACPAQVCRAHHHCAGKHKVPGRFPTALPAKRVSLWPNAPYSQGYFSARPSARRLDTASAQRMVIQTELGARLSHPKYFY